MHLVSKKHFFLSVLHFYEPVLWICNVYLFFFGFSFFLQSIKEKVMLSFIKQPLGSVTLSYQILFISWTQLSSLSPCNLEDSDFNLCRRARPVPQRGVLSMILNCIWWWDSNSGDLVNVGTFSLLLLFTLTWSGHICYSPIYGSNRSVWK